MPDVERGSAAATVEAQAKVNLRLRILAREAGGFHQLETLFLRVALSDTVRLRVTTGTRSLDVEGVRAGDSLGPVEQNLAWRAAAAYADAGRWPGGFAIEIVKRIPVGGGLGGGSADGGAVLRLLDALAPQPMPAAGLLRIAAALGADVPFLSTDHAFALAWGRGERLLPLPPPPPRRLLLVVPPFAVGTADAYRWLADARGSAASPPEPALLALASLGDWEALASLATNDFQPVVAERHPEVAAIVTGLRAAGCPIALMSGSGSVVVGVPPDSGLSADGVRIGLPGGAALLETWTLGEVAPPSAHD